MEFFEEIHDKYHGRLKSFALGLSRDMDLADELVQETFVRALSNVELLRMLPDYKRRAWLFNVLKNHFIDLKRRLRFESACDEDFDAEWAGTDPDSRIDALGMLATLSPDLRDVVYKKYWLGMTSAEISQELSVSGSTIRSRLQAAIEYLRRKNAIEISEG